MWLCSFMAPPCHRRFFPRRESSRTVPTPARPRPPPPPRAPAPALGVALVAAAVAAALVVALGVLELGPGGRHPAAAAATLAPHGLERQRRARPTAGLLEGTIGHAHRGR